MLITPLQKLLIDKVKPISEVMQYVGVSRTSVWRWKTGHKKPHPEREVPKLIELYDGQLDYNGCYEASVWVGEEDCLDAED